MSRMIFTPALPSIMEEYRLTYTQAGVLASAVFWIYAPMMFLSGYLGDRLGRKRILLAGMFGWSILCFFTPWALSLTGLLLFRFFMGFAQGTYFGNDRAILTAHTPPDGWGFAQGITMMGAGWGNFLALFLGGLVVGMLGWRYIFYFVGGASLVVAFLSLRFIPSLPPSPSSVPTDVAFRWPKILFRRELLILYLLSFMVMNIFWIFGIWIPSIFMEMGIQGPMEASLYGSLYALGGIPGMLLFGLFTDWAQKKGKVQRSTVLSLSLSLTTIFLLTMALFFRPGVEITPFCALVALLGFFIPGLWPPPLCADRPVYSAEGLGDGVRALQRHRLSGGHPGPHRRRPSEGLDSVLWGGVLFGSHRHGGCGPPLLGHSFSNFKIIGDRILGRWKAWAKSSHPPFLNFPHILRPYQPIS